MTEENLLLLILNKKHKKMPIFSLKKAQNLSEGKRKTIFFLIFSVIFLIILGFWIGLTKHKFLSWNQDNILNFKESNTLPDMVDFKEQTNELQEQWQDLKNMEQMLKNIEAEDVLKQESNTQDVE